MDSILSVNKMGKKSDVLLVFSARDTEKGKFTFFSMTKDLKLNIIYINDYSNQWYLNGTPEFESHDEFIKYLKIKIEELISPEHGKIYTLGSSMGAYAALKYGSLLEADKILALGPESELMLPHGRSVSSVKVVPEDKGNICKLTYKKPENVIILSGNNDIVDFYCACSFKENNENINVSLINNRTHVVAKYINANFGLANILSAFFERNDDSFLKKMELSKTVSFMDAEFIRQFDDGLKNNIIKKDSMEVIFRISKELPEWSMIQFFSAKICQANNNIDKCISYLEQAILAQESLGRARLLLAVLRLENSELDKALGHFKILIKNPLTFAIAALGIDIYLALEDFQEAESLILSANNLNLSAGQQKNLNQRKANLENKLNEKKLKSALKEIITISKNYVSDIDLDSKNYSNDTHKDFQHVTINKEKKCPDSFLLIKGSTNKSFISLNLINARKFNLYIGHDFKGSTEINVYSDNSTIYIGNNVTLNGLKVNINSLGATCVIGNNVSISSGTQISFDSQSPDISTAQAVIIGDNATIFSNVLICSFENIEKNVRNTTLGNDTKCDNNNIIIEQGVRIGPASRVIGKVKIKSKTILNPDTYISDSVEYC